MIGRMDYLHKDINSVKQYYGYGQNELLWVLIVKYLQDTALKPGFHMSGKSQTIGDFAVSRLSQILPTNENSKS